MAYEAETELEAFCRTPEGEGLLRKIRAEWPAARLRRPYMRIQESLRVHYVCRVCNQWLGSVPRKDPEYVSRMEIHVMTHLTYHLQRTSNGAGEPGPEGEE